MSKTLSLQQQQHFLTNLQHQNEYTFVFIPQQFISFTTFFYNNGYTSVFKTKIFSFLLQTTFSFQQHLTLSFQKTNRFHNSKSFSKIFSLFFLTHSNQTWSYSQLKDTNQHNSLFAIFGSLNNIRSLSLFVSNFNCPYKH